MELPRHNLRTPGPTPCPEDVLDAMSGPMINHRGPEFSELIFSITEKLQKVFGTEEDVFVLTSSGTGCLEAAIVNTLSPGDKVLAVTVGSFGDRFANVAQAYGAEVIRLNVEWGKAADPDAVRDALATDPDIKAVLITHNETSTGITNDLQSLSKVIKDEFDKLFLVDAVSSLGCIPLPMDEWRCDVVGTASQKGMMVPPGLGFISMSADAWAAHKTSTMGRFYFDLGAAQRYLRMGQTPWTPGLSLYYGLNVALDLLMEEGMEQVYRRHARLAHFTRESLKAMGLELFADPAHASDTVTAVWTPEGIDGPQLLEQLRVDDAVVLAEGQGKMEGKLFRVGHMGYVEEDDLRAALGALERGLAKAGYRPVGAAGG